jgi:methylenetetrahydrofolate dehydrogenase (NADP+)/methenyltetrahydrofolate cyclohydrolase
MNSRKDIDGFTYENLGKIMSGKEGIIPCTPKGILLILEKLQVDVAKKNIVILGRSKIVGRPIAELLISRGATVTVCNSNTQNIEEYTKNADILIVAIGKPLYINKKMVKENSVVIDVGINSYNGKIVGDVDTLDIADYVRYVTPVPGGVGLTTVISLMDNLVKLAMENKN